MRQDGQKEDEIQGIADAGSIGWASPIFRGRKRRVQGSTGGGHTAIRSPHGS